MFIFLDKGNKIIAISGVISSTACCLSCNCSAILLEVWMSGSLSFYLDDVMLNAVWYLRIHLFITQGKYFTTSLVKFPYFSIKSEYPRANVKGEGKHFGVYCSREQCAVFTFGDIISVLTYPELKGGICVSLRWRRLTSYYFV